MVSMDDYLWMVIVGFIFGFGYAFGIGANDVANAFGSTVASKSLTLTQAVIAAAIFEFLGALLLGAGVTNTIRSKIFDPDLYIGEEDIVFLGMFTSLITGTIMLNGATYFALPVSTTHTIVGCIMGFSIVAKGFDSIDWETGKKIFMSWLISPCASAIIGFIFFGMVKYMVLVSENPFTRAFYTFPIILTTFIGIDMFYILYKGFNNKDWAEDLEIKTVLPYSFGAGLACGLIWLFPLGGIASRRAERFVEEQEEAARAKDKEAAADNLDPEEKADEDLDDAKAKDQDVEEALPVKKEEGENVPETKKGFFQQLHANTVGQDLHAQSMSESKRASEIWDSGVKYDAKAEQLFTYVQVFTACLNSFAHGANDVANAIAP